MPQDVHDALRHIAADKHMSVEARARDALRTLAASVRTGGIDFWKLARDKFALGITDEEPRWTEAMDDPKLSRDVPGL